MATLLSKPVLVAILATLLTISAALVVIRVDVHRERVAHDLERAEAARQQAVAAQAMRSFRVENTTKALKAIKDR